MRVIRLTYPFDKQTFEHQVLAIGDFDGVHLGHQSVIGQAVEIAREKRIQSAMMTFDPHPRQVLGLQMYEYLLTPFSHKLRLLQKLDVDVLYIVEFTTEFAQIPAAQFIQKILNQMNLHTVVVGFDFTFGHRGQGNATYLKMSDERQFAIRIVDPHMLSERKISSTRIRECLAAGDVTTIPSLLGRYYDLIGIVQQGDGRGRKIGYPTANLQLDGSYIFPKLGVYAVYAHVQDKTYQAVVNIGVRPTFIAPPAIANVEVHLLDFQGDLYEHTMSIELVQFIRPEQKFDSLTVLTNQIELDIARAREILA